MRLACRLRIACGAGPVPVGGLRIPSSRSFRTTALLCCSFLEANSKRKILLPAGQPVKFIESLRRLRALPVP